MPTGNTFTDYKITAISEIAGQVRKWRKEGQSLVFTNGCFDLLHAGHIRYLQTAAAFADIFILGLNSDSSVRKLKGLSRPIMSQPDRALLLSARPGNGLQGKNANGFYRPADGLFRYGWR